MEKVARMKTIKVSEETYAALCRVAGELQVVLRRPVSLDEAVRHLSLSFRVRGYMMLYAEQFEDLEGSASR